MTTEPTLFDSAPWRPPAFMLDTGLVGIPDNPQALNHASYATSVARTLEAGLGDPEAWRLILDTATENEATRALDVAKVIYGPKLRRRR